MSESSIVEKDQQRKGAWVRTIFRIVLVLLIGTGIGVGIFYGASYLARNFFGAVQSNSDDLALVTMRLDQLEVQVNTRLDDLTARVDTLELQNDDQKLLLSEIETSIANLETASTALDDRLVILEDAAEEWVESVSLQDSAISSLETRYGELEDKLTGINTDLEGLTDRVDTIDILLGDWKLSTSDEERTIQQIKALLLLSRVQLYISQNNYGLAQQDIASVYEILQVLAAAETETAQAYQGILDRLDSALLNLPETPISANADVESAWNNLWTMINSDLENLDLTDEDFEPTGQP